MYICLDETIITFTNLQCDVKEHMSADDVIKAEVFERHHLNPLEQYHIYYEKDSTKVDEHSYFVYFAREKAITEHLDSSANKNVDFVLFYPQVFTYLFENKSIAKHFLVLSNIDTRIFISIFHGSQLIYAKQLSGNSEMSSLISDISNYKIDDIFIYSDTDSKLFNRVVADVVGEKQICTIDKIDWNLAKKHAHNFSTKQRARPLFKRASGIMLLSAVFFITTITIYEVANFLYQKQKISLEIANSKAEQSKLTNLRNRVELKNKECVALATKVQNQKNELVATQNSISRLQEVRSLPSIVDEIVKVANSAKNFELRFENLCFTSGEINIKLTSQNPATISAFSSALASNNFDIFHFSVHKTDSGYKGQISGIR